LAVATPDMQERHLAGFISAVRNKDQKMIDCQPWDAFQSTATVQLAMISYNTGSIVRWDKEKNTVIDNPGAAALMKREYRGKYIHPCFSDFLCAVNIQFTSIFVSQSPVKSTQNISCTHIDFSPFCKCCEKSLLSYLVLLGGLIYTLFPNLT
jgi:hypothetical protein